MIADLLREASKPRQRPFRTWLLGETGQDNRRRVVRVDERCGRFLNQLGAGEHFLEPVPLKSGFGEHCR